MQDFFILCSPICYFLVLQWSLHSMFWLNKHQQLNNYKLTMEAPLTLKIRSQNIVTFFKLIRPIPYQFTNSSSMFTPFKFEQLLSFCSTMYYTVYWAAVFPIGYFCRQLFSSIFTVLSVLRLLFQRHNLGFIYTVLLCF